MTGATVSAADTATGRVEAARRALGRVGVFLPHSMTAPTPVDEQREAVRRFERAGYRAAWVNGVPGKDALVQLAVLLAATEHLGGATGRRPSGCEPPLVPWTSNRSVLCTDQPCAAPVSLAHPGEAGALAVPGLGNTEADPTPDMLGRDDT